MYISVPGVSNDLQVFPPNSESFRISLPFPLGIFGISSGGRTIYGSDMGDIFAMVDPKRPRKPGLLEIDLDSGRVTSVPGSSTFAFYEIAIASGGDRLIISGSEPGPVCGIFELTNPGGRVRLVAKAPSCDAKHPWRDLSLSPDGVRATATLDERLHLIDMTTGDVRTLGAGNYVRGAWSPDGKWLAVVEVTGGKTILLDAHTFEEKKTLGRTDLEWSPDSTYLLARTSQLLCGPGEAGTFELVNVDTGKRTEIRSSRCLIDRSTTGWVSSQIASKRGG